MMRIRADQMRALQCAVALDLYHHLVTSVGREHPDRDDVPTLVEEVILFASELGFAGLDEVPRPAHLMAVDAEGLPYPPFPIEVHAYGTEDVDWTPQRFLMRGAAGAAPETAATVELYSLLAGERLLVTDARLVGEGTERLTLKVEPNLRDSNGRSARWTLRVGPKQPFGEGIVRGKVVVELEGREPVEIELAINAN